MTRHELYRIYCLSLMMVSEVTCNGYVMRNILMDEFQQVLEVVYSNERLDRQCEGHSV
jgi:hypothetical protein